ncbi:PepSY-associated TM helix domain-containing protein [Labilibacter marinus]|uniref:PepSY-associated TM helix domain-containing protein n=1 Tax=Labilibacter marinus TaxID=1477105 RepID=UPI0009F89B35|nr:PepSY-associated TM helix domain-containing protein [Labilibacter marinus]
MSKKRVRWIKRFKTWHKWPAIIIAFLAVLFAVSGIVMNHRSVFSSAEVSRKLLPQSYTYKHWNLDAVKGSLVLSDDSVFVYGKAGVFLTDKSFTSFSNYNKGFPSGIDNRSITSLIHTQQTGLVAGTLHGLYLCQSNNNWQKVSLPVSNERITDLTQKGDTLIILTRDYMLKSVKLINSEVIEIAAPEGYKKQTSWFKFLWNLHSGELFGIVGKLLVDLLGIVVIIISITGLIHYFYRKYVKKKISKSFKQQNLNWHNKLGYWFVLFLMINALSGMFLRPPLLIAIAKAKMSIIPHTHLDNDNPWYDKLRKIRWNEDLGIYILSSSEGFYFLNETCSISHQPKIVQPPVSVMGCNVLQQVSSTEYIVGSFSGLFSWNIKSGLVYDVGNGKPYATKETMGRPISNHMVSGLVYLDNANAWYSDYNKGMQRITAEKEFAEMPKVIAQAPISLWNLCLEIHTGRIFESFLGPFYILYVPLSGICVLMVLVSGFFLWYWVYRKKKSPKEL